MKWFCNLLRVDFEIDGNVYTRWCVGLGLHHRPVAALI